MPPDATAFLWLHGFASSPRSGKATDVRARLAARGAWLQVPDLNLPEFRTLTVGRMLAQVDLLVRAQGARRVVLFGSSLGGFTAARWAALHPEACAALVLLAPAFALVRRWVARLPPGEEARWRAEGSLPFDHWAWGTKERLDQGFLDEGALHGEFPLPAAPTLVLQGRKDEVVEPPLAREFERRMREAGKSVRLVELDDGHELNADLPGLWGHIEPHLAAAGAL